MRILIYGECEKIGSGAWCYAEAIRELGHGARTVDPATSLREWNQGLAWRIWRRFRSELPGFLLRRHSRMFQEALLQSKPDLVLVLKGLWITAEDVVAARDSGASTALVNHDDYFSHNRFNWSVVQRRALSCYDKLYSTRRINVNELRRRGLNAEFFPFSYHPPIHHVVAPRDEREIHEYEADVIFVGTYERDRAKLLEYLAERTDLRVAIYGEQWWKLGPRSPLRRGLQSRFLAGDELCLALGQAKCALGFLRKENRDEYTQRTLEIPACGGVLVAERTQEHIRMLREGLDAEFFDSMSHDEMVSKVTAICSSPAQREMIRENGRKAVAALRYTYADRVQQLLTDAGY